MNDPKNSSEGRRNDESMEAQDKVQHPIAHFENPADVVVDAVLTKDEKVRALETLEEFDRRAPGNPSVRIRIEELRRRNR